MNARKPIRDLLRQAYLRLVRGEFEAAYRLTDEAERLESAERYQDWLRRTGERVRETR